MIDRTEREGGPPRARVVSHTQHHSHTHQHPRTQPAGINVVSRIRCYGLFWTMNPLRKVLCHEKPWGKHGSVAAVAVSTLQGHLLEGTARGRRVCPSASDL